MCVHENQSAELLQGHLIFILSLTGQAGTHSWHNFTRFLIAYLPISSVVPLVPVSLIVC